VENARGGLNKNGGSYIAEILVKRPLRFIIVIEVTILALASLLLAPLRPPLVVHAQGRMGSAEQTLFDSANRERAAQGLPQLRWNNSLANAAQQHAQRMAQQNTLSHQLPGEENFKARAIRAGARFSSLAENVAEGPSVAGIHLQWMNSTAHRENLLDPDLDSIGIGVAQRNGQLFAVEDFSRAVADLSLDEQERELAALLKARGLRLLNGGGTMAGASGPSGSAAVASGSTIVDEARQTCSLDKGYAGKHQPSFLLRYTTADLESLPVALSQQIRSGRYHSVAIGACAPVSRSDFANYRLAVLLYE
jgi:uncharacterized protein YkwD